METPTNIPCSQLVATLTELAHNAAPKKYNHIKTIPRQHTTYLTDTADAVREVAKKLGKTRVKWDQAKAVMIITKPGDRSLIGMTREIALHLIETPRYAQESGIACYVDEKLKSSRRFKYDQIIEKHPIAAEKLKFWTPELCALNPKMFDFIITLGGDGTVLFSSWLFQSYIPPVIPFHLGSLGFLTPFDFDRYKEHLHNAMEKGARINLRGRLTCTVYRKVAHPDCPSSEDEKVVPLRRFVKDPITGKFTVGSWCQGLKKKQPEELQKKKFGEVDGDDVEDIEGLMENEISFEEPEERRVPCFTTVPVEKYHVINDLVIDRGPSPYVSLLELFGDDKHLTTVQADGLAISTPTGSTAYSLSAGGSLTHPEIHAILITPICPHTLSFRPTLVPDSMELRICVPFNSRNTAWASFDGRGRVELRQGDHIKVTASKYPFPTVCKEDQATDWFNSLQNCLHWNKRERQKSFAVVESNPIRHHSKASSVSSRNSIGSQQTLHSRTSHSPPRKSSSISSSSSETGPDQVFAKIYDSDSASDGLYSRRRSSVYDRRNSTYERRTSVFEPVSSESSVNDDYDEFESDSDEFDLQPDDFTGWTDDEIKKSRYMASITKELEKVSLKYTTNDEIVA